MGKNKKNFLISSMLIVLIAIAAVVLLITTDGDTNDASVSLNDDVNLAVPGFGLNPTTTIVEPGEDFSFQVLPVIPASYSDDESINVAELIIYYNPDSFEVLSVQADNDVLIAGEKIENEIGVLSFDVANSTTFTDQQSIVTVFMKAKDDAQVGTLGNIGVNNGASTLGLPDVSEGIVPEVIINIEKEATKIFGEACVVDEDCKPSADFDFDPICNSNNECANPYCPESTLHGTVGQCKDKTTQCGELCGGGRPECAPGFSCRYVSEDQCSISTEAYCVPNGSQPDRRGEILGTTYNDQPVETKVCPVGDTENSYVYSSTEENKTWTTQEIAAICQQSADYEPPTDGENVCPDTPVVCGEGQFRAPVDSYTTDSGLCTVFSCIDIPDQECPQVDPCTGGQLVSTGYDENGCVVASCAYPTECTPIPTCDVDEDGNTLPCAVNEDDPNINWCPEEVEPVDTKNACVIDNGDNTIDATDFGYFAANYKKDQLPDCSRDIAGNDCRYTIADFQVLGRAYKVAGLCKENQPNVEAFDELRIREEINSRGYATIGVVLPIEDYIPQENIDPLLVYSILKQRLEQFIEIYQAESSLENAYIGSVFDGLIYGQVTNETLDRLLVRPEILEIVLVISEYDVSTN